MSALSSAPESTAAPAMDAAAEAARYALLRRLAPSMRHHLVVNLQPIGMVYEIVDRRLRAPEPNLADIQDGAHKINSYARAALASCLDVITWLAPDDNARITAAEGVRECLSLVQTALTFRGFGLRDDLGEVAGEVRRASFRNVFTGALIHLTDDRPPPAQVVITAEAKAETLDIVLRLQPTVGDNGFATTPTYRPLTWGDVQALAGPEGVQVTREGQGLRVSLPWALASA